MPARKTRFVPACNICGNVGPKEPVVTQETGFSKFILSGEGLFRFSTMEEVVAALEVINGDYIRHAHAARRVAVEYFAADKGSSLTFA